VRMESDRGPGFKPVLSSMHACNDDDWNDVVEVVSPAEVPHLLRWLVSTFRRMPGREAFIFRGTSGFSEGYRDFLAAGVARRVNPRAAVVISDATMEPGSAALRRRLPAALHGPVHALSRALVRFVDGENVTWCVLSTDEVQTFRTTWPVRRGKVVFTPFNHTLHGVDLDDLDDAVEETPDAKGHVFSGGNSLRNYPLLLDAVRGLDVELRVATSWRPPASEPLRNSFRPTTHDRFVADMASSAVVVLPLTRAERSTGQQTYLNAMALSKVVVVNDAPGVRDHVTDGQTGIVVSSVGEMRQAIVDVLDPANRERYAEMGRRARREVLGANTPRHYRRELLELATPTRS
jgi:glycosyltransferase involved in cell wall biosynthesis